MCDAKEPHTLVLSKHNLIQYHAIFLNCKAYNVIEISSMIDLEYPTNVQYTQTDTIRQNTLTNRTIGKLLRFVKEALRFVPFARMVR